MINQLNRKDGTMTIKQFIDRNWKELQNYINAETNCYHLADLDYDEAELWIMNDEHLYLWAKDDGVDV